MSDWQDRGAPSNEVAHRFLAGHRTLHDVISARADVVKVVIQDEYTHDIVVRLPPSFGSLLVVFDST